MEEPVFSIAEFPGASPPQSGRCVTCAATSAKLVLLGYADGAAALFDVFGNLLDEQRDRHSSAVVSVALGAGTASDDVAASASTDGVLRANNLFDRSAGSSAALLAARTGLRTRIPKGISAIAVDPDYGKPRSGERVAYADKTGRVALYTSGWFGGSEILIAKEDTKIHSMVWAGLLLGWSSEKGVQIYDTRLQRMVCFVEAPQVVTAPALIDLPEATSLSPESAPPAIAEALVDGSPGAVSDPSGIPAKDQNILVAEKAAELTETEAMNEDGLETLVTGVVTFADALVSSDCLWKTSIVLRIEGKQDEKPTAYGERTQTLYIAWPSLSKVVVIGPHIEHNPSDQPRNETASGCKPPRHVETLLTISRTDVPVPLPESSNSFLASPMLSIAPFGNHVAVLTGSSDHQLVLTRVKKDSLADVHSMQLDHSWVNAAELFPIPGGEPLLLVLAQGCEEERMAAEEHRKKLFEGASAILVPADDEDSSTVSVRTEVMDRDDSSRTGHGEKFSNVCFARALGVAERIKWMLDRGRFEDALKTAEIAPGGSLRRAELSIADVGHQFLESICASGDYERLVEVLPRTIISTSPTVAVRGRDKVMRFRRERWEHWISVMRSAGKLEIIAPLIPCHEPRMSDVQYNDVLTELAETNPVAMLNVLKSWPSDVYDVPAITRAVEMQSATMIETEEDSQVMSASIEGKSRQREALREALFMLYGLSGRHDETLNLLLQERSSRVFSYVRSHDLYEAVRSTEAVSGMYAIDKDEASDLLVNAPGTLLPPEAVVPILKGVGNEEWLCLYLSGVFRQDPERSTQYHNLLVQLLVNCGRPGALYSFLKTSTHFSLDAALTLMGGRAGKGPGLFGRERVHVLATMGDLNAAMDILLNELQDVHSAIDFASEHEDIALWDRLIEHARGNADTLAALLDSPAGGKVNPVRLIPLISSQTEIKHLRDRLHRILVDAALERALREETAAALQYDASRYMANLDDAILRPL